MCSVTNEKEEKKCMPWKKEWTENSWTDLHDVFYTLKTNKIYQYLITYKALVTNNMQEALILTNKFFLQTI